MLLLDEPTNHLDAESVAWLEHFLQQYEGTVIAVTHDRYFLDEVAGWILEIEPGKTCPFEGNYSSWLESKQKRLDLGRQKDARRAKTLANELKWIQKNPRGGRVKDKARVSRIEEMQRQEAEESAADRVVGGAIVIPPGPRVGSKVLEVSGLYYAHDDDKDGGGDGYKETRVEVLKAKEAAGIEEIGSFLAV